MIDFKKYEQASEQVLPENLPVIARIDGNCFSSLTDKHFTKPFDSNFEKMMNDAAKGVMEYCTQADIAYIHSDEISLLLPPTHDPFASGRTQKLASLLAGHASAHFSNAFGKPAAFDCRVFVMPKDEVLDYFVWRQETAWSNCVHSVAFYELVEEADRNFANERLEGADLSEMQELLFSEFGINANDIPVHRKRGRAWRRETRETPIQEWIDDEERYKELKRKGYIDEDEVVERRQLELDKNMPEIQKNHRYIDHFLFPEYPSVA